MDIIKQIIKSYVLLLLIPLFLSVSVGATPSLCSKIFNVFTLKKNKQEKIIKELTEAIKLDPNNADNYANRADSYETSGKYRKAINELGKAIEIDPKNAFYYTKRASIYLESGNHKDALKDTDEATKLNPKSTSSYVIRALAHEALGNYQKALESINKAIELDSENETDTTQVAGLYYTRAFIYLKLPDKPKEALRDIKKAIYLDPKNEVLYYIRSFIYANEGKYKKARKDIKQALKLNPFYKEALQALSELNQN